MKIEADFPFHLQASTETATSARTPVIRRTDYPNLTVEFIRDGAGYLAIDGREFYVQAGDIYLLTPGSTHEYRPDPHKPWYKIFFAVTGPLMEQLFHAYGLDGVYHLPKAAEFRHYFAEMSAVHYDDRQAAVVFHQFAAAVSERLRGAGRVLPQDVIELGKTLKASLDQSFILRDYARMHQVSPTRLIRRFTAAHGVTPGAYLLKLRIESARRLLLYSHNSIKEIASQLAFSDQYYFSNRFKRATGLSPLAFRRKYLKLNEKHAIVPGNPKGDSSL